MIRFSCRCGYIFEAPDDAAGIGLQCPDCHLLNDVPFAGDLNIIAADGTYGIDDKPRIQSPDTLEKLAHFYESATLDGRGESADLRASGIDDEIGEYETVPDAAKRNKPRYDPETGELLKPIPFAKGHEPAPVIDPSTIPFARPTVNYAVNDTIRPKSTKSVFLDLLQPINLLVMGFVLLIHFFIVLMTFGMAMGFLLVAPLALAAALMIMSHYGNVVDEIGRCERDELPRVLRDLQFYEDVWHPFMCIAAGTLICYGPVIFFLRFSPLPMLVTGTMAAALAMAGAFFMPAILLTLLTSGSIANLLPNRILGVIRVSGIRYFGLIGAFLVAVIPYAWGIGACTILAYAVWRPAWFSVPGWTTSFIVFLPVMCFAIFAMHFFFWQLGVLYRLRSPMFPWVDQYHIREPRPPVPRRKPKYIAPPGEA
jgi:hypothetical protein